MILKRIFHIPPYSKHVLDTGHALGTMEETMDVVRIGRKGQYLNTLEKYYIYKISKQKLLNRIPFLKNYKKFTTRHLPIPFTPPPNTVTEYIYIYIYG
jgi:hypothetical protein